MGEHLRNQGEPPTGDYPVGYKRPPKHTQFVAGKSGNPSGKPPKMKLEKDRLTEILGTTVQIPGPDGPIKSDILDLVLRRLVKDAADGKATAIKLLLGRMDAHGIGNAPVEPDLDPEETEIALRLLAEYGELFPPKKPACDD